MFVEKPLALRGCDNNSQSTSLLFFGAIQTLFNHLYQIDRSVSVLLVTTYSTSQRLSEPRCLERLAPGASIYTTKEALKSSQLQRLEYFHTLITKATLRTASAMNKGTYRICIIKMYSFQEEMEKGKNVRTMFVKTNYFSFFYCVIIIKMSFCLFLGIIFYTYFYLHIFLDKLYIGRNLVCMYERVQPVGLISLSCNWAILHNEINQMQVKIQ